MDGPGILAEAFGRIGAMVHGAVEGLSDAQLAAQLDERANSIAWLVWHLTRIEDDHVAGVAGSEQLWLGEGWFERCGLPFERDDTGYGHRAEQVAAVHLGATYLLGYFDAVDSFTRRYVRQLTDDDLDRVVDRRWDPPVTLGVRLVSVINDAVAHAGQAAFVRGILERR